MSVERHIFCRAWEPGFNLWALINGDVTFWRSVRDRDAAVNGFYEAQRDRTGKYDASVCEVVVGRVTHSTQMPEGEAPTLKLVNTRMGRPPRVLTEQERRDIVTEYKISHSVKNISTYVCRIGAAAIRDVLHEAGLMGPSQGWGKRRPK